MMARARGRQRADCRPAGCSLTRLQTLRAERHRSRAARRSTASHEQVQCRGARGLLAARRHYQRPGTIRGGPVQFWPSCSLQAARGEVSGLRQCPPAFRPRCRTLAWATHGLRSSRARCLQFSRPIIVVRCPVASRACFVLRLSPTPAFAARPIAIETLRGK